MNSIDGLRLVAIVLTLLGVAAIGWWVRGDHQVYRVDNYDCAAPREFVMGPKTPISAEIYMTGWIEKGELTIDGVPPDPDQQSVLRFVASGKGTPIAVARSDEWYSQVRLKFTPTSGASCRVHIVHAIG